MARRTVARETKKDIAMRLQRIIDGRSWRDPPDAHLGGFYWFKKWAKQHGHEKLGATAKNWLPPQQLWKKKPNGAAVPGTHWDAIKLPDPATLIEFCELLEVEPGWLLFGLGWDGQPVDEPVYRGQQRPNAALEVDLAAYVLRTLRKRGVDLGTATARDINGKQLLADAVRSVASYAERLRATVDATTTAALERVAAKALADDPSPARRAEVREFLANTPPAAPKIQGLLTRPHYLNGAGLVSDPRAQGVARRTTQT